ncbi:hypothetical protein LGL55_04645 [Clostridium tagluense]|uniref:hypothetical protein n=1 Tax=Clostridium TaxID=1485 RepID=UPI0013E98B3E|nr:MULTISPECIES: hypothetical protein [Clostridium]MBU3128515.1 hypothetical protein [Clostridium tagluense]MBZ9625635.1 hypothetical protein [Clostridium sp. FP2]MCB2310409.1 hypothetical protein [Clostridium tagluense]MCB2315425.1 hypothetical protein [Clostridium tagluense]MCB2320278.1 hypothetical protein [Clostridium tagluense]
MSEKKDIADANKKRKTFKIILFLSIIMTSTGIFFASYYSSLNKVYASYETTITKNIKGINEVNKNIEQLFNTNGTIDVEYAKKQLPSSINDLTKLKDNLTNSKPTSKYKKDHENLKLGLDNNLSIYRQALAILNDPSGSSANEFGTTLKTYRNDCMNFYSLIDIYNVKIALPKTSLTFIDDVLNDSYMAIRMQVEEDIKSNQTKEFISKIDTISKSFLDIKINYYSYVLKVRKNNMSYDDLLLLIGDNLVKLSNVQTTFKSLSIPTSTAATYESFKPLLGMYENYLKDFKLALTNEKIQALSAAVDSSTSESLYTSSNLKFAELENYYSVFIKTFIELKNK